MTVVMDSGLIGSAARAGIEEPTAIAAAASETMRKGLAKMPVAKASMGFLQVIGFFAGLRERSSPFWAATGHIMSRAL